MSTRAEIVTDLKNLIGPAVEVDDSGLAMWVNDAYSQMLDEIIKVNPDFFAKTYTTNLVDGTQEYALPSDFEKMVMVNIKIDASTWKRCMPMGNADIRFIPTHSDTTSTQGFSTAEPKYYIIGDYLGLMPIPDTSIGSGLKFWYQYTPTQLTTDASLPDIPDRYHHIIKYGAYANYLDQDDEHASAERMRMRFDLMVQRMVENLSSRQEDEEQSVQITQNIDLYADDTTYI